ncbi:MAG: L-threonylcarbamoyladenylate synthase, partial [Chitinophagaceae bacterium]|nr:L-threonylcarbamoyladenylate synthase [Chitinophagaceae bacterium]
PLIMHVPDWQAAQPYLLQPLPESARALAGLLMPGPLTMLLPKTSLVPDLLTAGSPKVAIRIPAHPMAKALLQSLPFPLAAPSANRFGYVSPVTARHVFEGLQGRLPYILDGGACQVGLESTIIDFEGDELIIRRAGSITAAQLEAITGQKPIFKTDAADHPVAPGMLQVHYATHTPLLLGPAATFASTIAGKKIMLLGWGSQESLLQKAVLPDNCYCLEVMSLSPDKDLTEVAANLFAGMRHADQANADFIVIHPFPDEGIGRAINDRLKRAAAAIH